MPLHCHSCRTHALTSSFSHSQDYGTLLCWASNEIGDQSEPCVYTIAPAGEYRAEHSTGIQTSWLLPAGLRFLASDCWLLTYLTLWFHFRAAGNSILAALCSVWGILYCSRICASTFYVHYIRIHCFFSKGYEKFLRVSLINLQCKSMQWTRLLEREHPIQKGY